MKIFTRSSLLTSWLNQQSKEASIGFVPTMGALHRGHLSLINASRKENDITVCSIFVNPTQFNDPADLDKYPRTPTEDLALLRAAGCEVVLLPAVEDIYSDPAIKERSYDLQGLDQPWEGAHRPGHFQGVCMVVHRLLEIVPAHSLYLGQKDWQQMLILRKMISQLPEITTKVVPCPIVREEDGLAMSSRNALLTPQERHQSIAIYQTLQWISAHIHDKPWDVLLAEARERLHVAAPLISAIEYLALVNGDTLAPASEKQPPACLLAITAVQFPSARLIDNIIIKD